MAAPADGFFSDEALCAAILENFGLEVQSRLPRSSGDIQPGQKYADAKCRPPLDAHSSLEAFVELNRRLINMEREAEIAQANSSLCSPEAAQVRLVCAVNFFKPATLYLCI